MKEHVFIGVDCGKFATKAILEYQGGTYIVLFRTKMQTTSDLGMELQENSFKVEFEGNEYLLGDMVSEDHSDFNLSKESLVHKLSIYTAIIELMKKANLQFHNVHLHVAINTPINVYKSQRLKNSYKDFMENNNRTISIRLNDKAYMFNLNDVTICFEGMGLVYQNTDEYSKHSSSIFDIGGLNTTMCTFFGIQPDFNSMIVSNLGISSLKAKVEQELVERFGLTVSANDLQQIMKNGYFNHLGKKIVESEEIIKKI
jgi:plasmid segregation protein ParM